MSHLHTVMPLLVWSLAVQLVLFGRGGHATHDNTKNCKLFSESPAELKALSLLEPLTNKTFSVGTKDEKDTYTYLFQVCGDVDAGNKGAGLIQKDKDGKTTVIGMYTETQAIGGSDWVMLIYRNGSSYDGHCSKEMRKAIIVISCDRNVDVGPLAVVLEDRDRLRDCFYLFEMDSSAVCPPAVKSPLGAFSIILIIAFCLLAVYLIGGFLYQRLVVGAKGMEQFPNYAFWVEFGNMAADGCDFVCRTRGSREEPPTYRGVPTEPVEEEPEERDDHLLPI